MSREYCRYCNAEFISGRACRTEKAVKACAEFASLTGENKKFVLTSDNKGLSVPRAERGGEA